MPRSGVTRTSEPSFGDSTPCVALITAPLSGAALVAPVCRVRNNIILMADELLLAEEAGRIPVSTVQLHAAVESDTRRDSVHETCVSLRLVVPRVGTKTVLALVSDAEHAATVAAMVEAGQHHRLGAPEASARNCGVRAAHSLERADVQHTGEREVSEERAGGPMKDVDVLHAARKDHRQIVVSLRMAVHRFV